MNKYIKSLIALLAAAAALASCGKSDGGSKESKTDLSSAAVETDEPSQDSAEEDGIYLPSIYKEDVSLEVDPMQQYSGSELWHDERMYESASIRQYENPIDMSDYEEIGKVYGNGGIYWADGEDMLAQATGEAVLYKVDGYDEKDIVCMYFENTTLGKDTYYELRYFICLNGIYVKTGKDVYEDRLHIENFDRVSISKKSSDDPGKVESYDVSGKSEIDTLFDKLFKSEILDLDTAKDNWHHFVDDGVKRRILRFEDKNGETIFELNVFENGYVCSNDLGSNCIMNKLDKKACGDVISLFKRERSS